MPQSKRAKGSGDRDPGGRFKPGHGVKSPGNPRIRHIHELREAVRLAITPERLQGVLAKMVLLAAVEGDTAAARLVLEHAIGRPRQDGGDATAVNIPRIEKAADLVTASSEVLEALARGDLTPADARALAEVIAAAGKSIELYALEQRLEVLEGRRADGPPADAEEFA